MELKGKRSKQTLLSCCFRRRKALDISKTVAEATDSPLVGRSHVAVSSLTDRNQDDVCTCEQKWQKKRRRYLFFKVKDKTKEKTHTCLQHQQMKHKGRQEHKTQDDGRRLFKVYKFPGAGQESDGKTNTSTVNKLYSSTKNREAQSTGECIRPFNKTAVDSIPRCEVQSAPIKTEQLNITHKKVKEPRDRKCQDHYQVNSTGSEGQPTSMMTKPILHTNTCMNVIEHRDRTGRDSPHRDQYQVDCIPESMKQPTPMMTNQVTPTNKTVEHRDRIQRDQYQVDSIPVSVKQPTPMMTDQPTNKTIEHRDRIQRDQYQDFEKHFNFHEETEFPLPDAMTKKEKSYPSKWRKSNKGEKVCEYRESEPPKQAMNTTSPTRKKPEKRNQVLNFVEHIESIHAQGVSDMETRFTRRNPVKIVQQISQGSQTLFQYGVHGSRSQILKEHNGVKKTELNLHHTQSDTVQEKPPNEADEKSSRNLCYNERCDDTMVGPPVWDKLSSCKQKNRLHESAQRAPTPVNTSYFEAQRGQKRGVQNIPPPISPRPQKLSDSPIKSKINQGGQKFYVTEGYDSSFPRPPSPISIAQFLQENKSGDQKNDVKESPCTAMSPEILDEAVTTDMYPSRLISKTDKILYGRRGLEIFPKPPSPINMSQLREKTVNEKNSNQKSDKPPTEEDLSMRSLCTQTSRSFMANKTAYHSIGYDDDFPQPPPTSEFQNNIPGSVMKPMFAVTKYIPLVKNDTATKFVQPVKNDTATKFIQPVKTDTTMETPNLYDRDWNIQTEQTQFGTSRRESGVGKLPSPVNSECTETALVPVNPNQNHQNGGTEQLQCAAKLATRVQGLKSPRTIERKNDLSVICEPTDKYHGAGVYMGGQPHFGHVFPPMQPPMTSWYKNYVRSGTGELFANSTGEGQNIMFNPGLLEASQFLNDSEKDIEPLITDVEWKAPDQTNPAELKTQENTEEITKLNKRTPTGSDERVVSPVAKVKKSSSTSITPNEDKIMSMGFTYDQAVKALKYTDDKLEAALDWLITGSGVDELDTDTRMEADGASVLNVCTSTRRVNSSTDNKDMSVSEFQRQLELAKEEMEENVSRQTSSSNSSGHQFHSMGSLESGSKKSGSKNGSKNSSKTRTRGKSSQNGCVVM